jgi:hypothetical protein
LCRERKREVGDDCWVGHEWKKTEKNMTSQWTSMVFRDKQTETEQRKLIVFSDTGTDHQGNFV